MDEEIPEPQLFPCGCFITYAVIDGVNTMRFSPCKMTCELYLDTISEGYLLNKTVRHEEA